MTKENAKATVASPWKLRRGIPFLALLAAVAMLVGGMLWFTEEQPRYNGRPLKYWVDRLDAAAPSATPSICAEAKVSVRAIGTNALPTLLAWLQHRDSALERRLNGWLYSKRMQRPLTSRFGVSEAHYHFRAGLGFQALGELARPALPTLERLLVKSDDLSSRSAATVIALIAPEDAERLVWQWCSSTNSDEVDARERLKKALADVKILLQDR